jgi:hypothetical protein
MTDLATDTAAVTGIYQGYLLEEDEALKKKLQGITITDPNNRARPVLVWYRMPQPEERTVTYPYIMIDFIGETIAHEREHRGRISPTYRPNTNVPYGEFDTPVTEFPIPMDLHYQVSAFARAARQDREMREALMDSARLHPRFAFLDCQGGTCRRMEVTGPFSGDAVDSDGKRLFRKIYNVSVSSEISSQVLLESRLKKIYFTLIDTNGGSK